MSKQRLSIYFKYLVFTLVFFAFCAFQSSFWPFVLDALPSPQLWLLFIIFISLKWTSVYNIFYIYFLGFCMTQFSYVSLKTIWMSLLAVTLFVWIFKNRIHSTSLFFFSILVSSTSLLYSIVYISTSNWLEFNPTPIYFLHRLLEIGCNFLFSIPVFKLLSFIEDQFKSSEAWGITSAEKDMQNRELES
jgi:hypothetical protein